MTKTNRLAVVTGGIGGIGSAICVRLAEDGHKVVATYHPSEEEKAQEWLAEMKNRGLDIGIAGGDVSSAEDAAAMMNKIQEEVGNVDILVNCAGITRDSMMKRMDTAKWDAVISTNLSSAFYVTKPVWDGMVERGYGRIVNVSSMNGQRGQAGQANYASAKAGMHGFTMTLAQEGAAKGITANTLAPGYVKTPMTDAIREDIREAIIATIPMKRFALPEEIASGVSFLAAEQQAYISGAIIPINGAFFMH
ncbi:MAG: acetoacetyl-CoA reductase [Chromatiaceae bacterium]|nr:acetoacetyl-CoA reductase [Gammaproteobacteria bacterium]MCB1879885.1 acetoacetyl-CoA reductase [Gammaproteobacteria bacterium]MCP5427438.1 acetoacetyl-CoA reductase [Chromatiaceae bacterium]MCP5447725.1 acetoacetyl-CoA reductase [Chromatiaceae bacterium]